MDIPGLQIIGPIAYQGKADCDNPRCTHRFIDGVMQPGCIGYHCVYCDAPCSMMGHRCDVAETLLEASRKLLDNEG